jgi:hypothetical protein
MKIKQVRRAVRNLLKVPIDRREPYAKAVSAQDTLEFAAMLLGIKPVFLLGRGFDDQAWISAVRQTASDLCVALVEDAYWNPDDTKLNIPVWFRDLKRAPERATYISAVPGVVSEIRKISAREWVTSAEEARLLRYPECCVGDHHHRALVTEETFFRAVMRVARGNEQEARRIVLDDVKFHLSDEEEAQMKWAQDVRPCPFTSVYMCVGCAASDRSPAQLLSRQYAKLARDLDSELFATLEKAARFEESMRNR